METWKVRTGSDDVGSWALRGELSLALGQGLVGEAGGFSTVCHSVSEAETTELGPQRRGDGEGHAEQRRRLSPAGGVTVAAEAVTCSGKTAPLLCVQ